MSLTQRRKVEKHAKVRQGLVARTLVKDTKKSGGSGLPPLGDMSAEEFRRYGHEIIDWIANYFERIEELPVLAQIEPGDLKAQLPTSPPERGESMQTILADVDRLIVPALTHW